MVINCPECGKSVSTEAYACPHCGATGSSYKGRVGSAASTAGCINTIAFWVFLGGVAFLIFYCMGGMDLIDPPMSAEEEEYWDVVTGRVR